MLRLISSQYQVSAAQPLRVPPRKEKGRNANDWLLEIACLPTILPAVSYIIFCGRRPQTTQSYASDFSRRDCGHTNTNKSTRMGTIARSDEQDEASSTYELSGPVFRAERGDNEFHDSYQEHGTRTTIGVALKHGQSSEPRKSGDSMQGISVKNETVIQISSRK